MLIYQEHLTKKPQGYQGEDSRKCVLMLVSLRQGVITQGPPKPLPCIPCLYSRKPGPPLPSLNLGSGSSTGELTLTLPIGLAEV